MSKLIRILLVSALFLFFTFSLVAKSTVSSKYYDDALFVDSLISKMTLREKIAQLFILAFNDDPQDKTTKETINSVAKEGIGGVIYMRSNLTNGVNMLNRLQQKSKFPLLVTIDGEWGVSMRFDSVIAFPRAMQLASLESEELVYKIGRAIGEQSKRVGVDLNFAPTVDINNNPLNPVINTRAFGQERERVAKFGIAYLRGMQSAGVAGCIKHFPGHGDTDVDSHKSLPVLNFSRERLDSVELYPFREAIEAGSDMVMVGHLMVPALDNSSLPASISKRVITDLLKGELEYNGIVITDALNMKGVLEALPPEMISLAALKAGCDLILMPKKVSKSIDIIEEAVKRGELSQYSINMRVKKMLYLKLRLGVFDKERNVRSIGIKEELNNPYYNSLIEEVAEKSLILIKNSNNIIPLKGLLNKRVALLSLGGDNFGKELAIHTNRYSKVDTVVLRGEFSDKELTEALHQLNNHDHIIISLNKTDIRPQNNFGIDSLHFKELTQFAARHNTTLLYFGNPLALSAMDSLESFSSIIIAHQNSLANNIAATHLIFGATAAQGRMPVNASNYKFGHSLKSKGNIRVQYSIPVDRVESLKEREAILDSIIQTRIDKEHFEGAKLMILEKNRVLLNKSYGSMLDRESVELSQISASITLLPAIIKLKEREILSLEEIVDGILISDLLMHRVDSEGLPLTEPKYNSSNIERLIKIIEDRIDTSYEEFVKNEILDPLEITTDLFSRDNIKTSAASLLSFMAMLYSGGCYADNNIFNKESVEELFRYLLYHSSSLNGSVIWYDPIKEIAAIYLIDGFDSFASSDLLIKNIREL